MVIQNDLLHLYGELISFLYIKCLVHLFGKGFQPIVVIEATVLGRLIQRAGMEEILRIPRGRRDKCAGIHIIIPCFKHFQMVCRALDIHLDPDLLQIILHELS